MRRPGLFARALFRLTGFVKRHRLLWMPAGWLSHRVASASDSSVLKRWLGPVRDRCRGAMSAGDVLEVLDALEREGLRYCLAGGWGVDALVGRRTRSHDDVDVALDDYDRDVAHAIDALVRCGFQLVSTHEVTTWMPRRSYLNDGAGHRVELVSLNWSLLFSAFGNGNPATRATLEDRVYAQGSIGGHKVPCLSAEVQLLYHTHFELHPQLANDVSLLHSELGASTPALHPS